MALIFWFKSLVGILFVLKVLILFIEYKVC